MSVVINLTNTDPLGVPGGEHWTVSVKLFSCLSELLSGVSWKPSNDMTQYACHNSRSL